MKLSLFRVTMLLGAVLSFVQISGSPGKAGVASLTAENPLGIHNPASDLQGMCLTDVANRCPAGQERCGDKCYNPKTSCCCVGRSPVTGPYHRVIKKRPGTGCEACKGLEK